MGRNNAIERLTKSISSAAPQSSNRGSILSRAKIGFGGRSSAQPAPEPEPPQETTQEPETSRVIIGRRGFCLLRPDGARAYATCAEVHAILLRAAKGHPDKALMKAAKSNAAELAEIQLKLCSGLDEGEGAKQMMVLVGESIKDAIAMATNASRAGDRVRRASTKNSSRAAAAASAPTASSSSSRGSARSSKRDREPQRPSKITEEEDGEDEEQEEAPPSKRRSMAGPAMMKRESSTGLSAGMSRVRVGSSRG